MRRPPALAILIGLLAIAGCGMLDPYPTAPRQPRPGAAPGPRVAICYNQVNTERAEVQKQAQQECATGTIAEQVDNDWHLDNCPLLLPERVTFRCVKPPPGSTPASSGPAAGVPATSVPATSVPAAPVSTPAPRQRVP